MHSRSIRVDMIETYKILEGHSVERMYLRQSCFDGLLDKTILEPRVAAASSRANTYT